MKIGIIGASGKTGSFVTQEALRQGYEVTAIVRDAKKIRDPNLTVLERDIFAITREDVQNFAAVIDAFRAPTGKEEQHLTSLEHLIAVFEDLPNTRLLVVGGAGSLYTGADRKTQLMNSPDFPPAFFPTASNMAAALKKLKQSKTNWTYLSPAAFYDPDGARTGKYALGSDVMRLNQSGESYVSYADYAIALIDEVKNQAHAREQFSVVAEKTGEGGK